MSYSHIFPGQGSQFPGMGRDIYESSAKARNMMERANEVLGFRITDIMFGNDEEALKATRVTQPAIYLHSVVLAACTPLDCPDMAGGHSLGEFSALAATGAMDFEDGLRLVAIRASEMQKCCESVPGTMAAVIGLPDETVEDVCSRIAGTVVPANYNCQGQVVISGEVGAVKEACLLLKEAGARRALPLPVGGAFHSPLMEPARRELAKAIERTEFRAPVCPVYQNVSALPETDPGRIRENLLAQLTSPVRWSRSVENMLARGCVHFTEIGPKDVLQGLVKRICSGLDFKDIAIEGIQ